MADDNGLLSCSEHISKNKRCHPERRSPWRRDRGSQQKAFVIGVEEAKDPPLERWQNHRGSELFLEAITTPH
jgi:hypothetical protein